ncbi:MAG: helix-turn-helix domain-containing protein [Acidaminococcales bacterium]|jgi:transcriptional regulator with XRE-family HTH domain|nr:helix-turn-helix domain-containing protein [Acidaminococcales bacterium]
MKKFIFDCNLFAERLKTLRIKNQLTLEQLGIDFGSSKGTFANLESMKRKPSFEVLIALANYFNVSLDYLVGRSDEPFTPACDLEREIKKRYGDAAAEMLHLFAKLSNDSKHRAIGRLQEAMDAAEKNFAATPPGKDAKKTG